MSEQNHHYRDGDVVLYRRNTSPVWQARFKNPDTVGWIRKSTKRRNIDDAAGWACDYYDEIRFKTKHGLAAETRTFGQVVGQYLRDLESDIEAGVRNPAQRKQYGFIVDRYLLPHFGKKPIDRIGLPELTRYQWWRDEKAGRRLTGSTIQSHNAVLRGIFKTALRHGWLKEHQVPEIRNDKVRSKRRPAFTLDEYKLLYRFMRKWCRTGKAQRTRDIRALLRDYVLIIANSGMRPGTETDSLRWRNIEEFYDPRSGEGFLRLWVTGKTGERELVPDQNARRYFERIRKRNGNPPPEAKVFTLPDGTEPADLNKSFKQCLAAAGLLYDRHGNKRTLYSLRHTYATFRLQYGRVSVFTLALNMGTSVEMIKRHYSHLTPAMAAKEITRRWFEPRTSSAKHGDEKESELSPTFFSS